MSIMYFVGLYRNTLDRGEAGQSMLAAWDALGETKVVVRGESVEQLVVRDCLFQGLLVN